VNERDRYFVRLNGKIKMIDVLPTDGDVLVNWIIAAVHINLSFR
jgi:hypothetical protein